MLQAEYLEMEKLIEQMDDEFGKSVHPQALELEKVHTLHRLSHRIHT